MAALGDLSHAHALQTKVRQKLGALLGEDHPLTLQSKDVLASILIEEQQWAAARDLFETVLARRRVVLGDRHPVLSQTRSPGIQAELRSLRRPGLVGSGDRAVCSAASRVGRCAR